MIKDQNKFNSIELQLILNRIVSMSAENKDCIGRILSQKKAAGKPIDKQAIAIAISECKQHKSKMAKGPHDVSRPDSDFAYVPKGKPKSERKLPIYDAAHVRNALARLNQTEGIPSGEMTSVKSKICRAARKFGIDSDLCGKMMSSKNSVIPVERKHIHL